MNIGGEWFKGLRFFGEEEIICHQRELSDGIWEYAFCVDIALHVEDTFKRIQHTARMSITENGDRYMIIKIPKHIVTRNDRNNYIRSPLHVMQLHKVYECISLT